MTNYVDSIIPGIGFKPNSPEDNLKAIQNIFKNVFAPQVPNLDPASVNGIFIQEEANLANNNDYALSQLFGFVYDPRISPGMWLDAICALSGVYRSLSKSSTVECVCTGSPGTVIPKGSQIYNTNKDIFVSDDDLTLGNDGTGTVIFSSQVTGPIPIDANTLNIIITRVNGWESVNNPSQGALGTSIESDYSLRSTREELIDAQASCSASAIEAAIYAAPNVINALVVENPTNEDALVGGVVLIPRSIYASVQGGDTNDIAAAISFKRATGTPMNGNTSGYWIDPANGKSYKYQFQRPDSIQLKVTINLDASMQSIATVDQIKLAIYNNFYGLSNTIVNPARVKIGSIINVSRFYPTLLFMGIYLIQTITIELASGGSPSFEIQLPISQIAALIQDNIIINYT